MPQEEILVEQREAGGRIDVFLTGKMGTQLSRSQIKKLIEEKLVTVSGEPVTPHYKIKAGDEIHISWPVPRPGIPSPEAIPLEILYEDAQLIVLNKPAGMVVHPAHGHESSTLVNALLYHVKKLSCQPGKAVRPGIVHRLDKDTSGVMVVAKDEKTHELLARQFKEHSVERIYHAVVQGEVQHNEGYCDEAVGRAFLNRKKIIVRPSGGKEALTYFKVIRRYKGTTYLEIRPQTGRTHQIRVHMAYLGHPVTGDSLYGAPSPYIQRQALHAKTLGFSHPSSGEKLYFESELPEDIRRLLARLERGS